MLRSLRLHRRRAALVAYYSVPILFCLAVHWIALKTWFYADDFAWLGLPLAIHSPHDLLDTLFGPRAQGTIRTLSERVYFLALSSIFGMQALPFRLWAFLTQAANIVLLIRITRRITGSALAGFLAPILWSANAALSIALNWSSAYNEICCAFFMLLAFYLLLRYVDTGQRKFWIAQWIVFVLGFGALELIVMYPALAAGYALCCARPHFRRTLYLFIPSALFTAFHFAYVPQTTDPVYAMHFDSGIIPTLWRYWAFSLGAWRPDKVDWRPIWLGIAVTVVITAALALFILWRMRRNDWRGLFLFGWFFLVILPVLPLTKHVSEYYLTMPTIGLAMLGAWALSSAHRLKACATLGYALAAVYLIVSISDIHASDRYFYARARMMKRLVTGLEATSEEHSGKKVLLSGVTNDLFSFGFWDDPFRLIGIPEIYLTPGSEKTIAPHPEWGGISRFIIPLQSAVEALNKDQAVVYSVDSQGIQNVTPVFKAMLTAQLMAERRVEIDVANPAYAAWLGKGWYKIENGGRWMAKSASVQMSGPRKPGQELHVTGFCPAAVLAKGPLTLTVSADGNKLGSATLKKPDQPFAFRFPLPGELVGKYAVEFTVGVNRTITPAADPRPLGLIFGTFTIK
jgi:hypothetical protein